MDNLINNLPYFTKLRLKILSTVDATSKTLEKIVKPGKNSNMPNTTAFC